LSKFLISYNSIKLLEQSLHAQNAVRLRELCPIFEVLCVIHRDPAGGALWTVGDIRLPAGALNWSGKHATFNSTFWQDAHICGDLHRVQLSSKNMFLPLFINK
jgi:hypothetical protein